MSIALGLINVGTWFSSWLKHRISKKKEGQGLQDGIIYVQDKLESYKDILKSSKQFKYTMAKESY